MTKIILVDCDSKTSQLQPRNSLVLRKWDGDPKDTDLLELIPFFHSKKLFSFNESNEGYIGIHIFCIRFLSPHKLEIFKLCRAQNVLQEALFKI